MSVRQSQSRCVTIQRCANGKIKTFLTMMRSKRSGKAEVGVVLKKLCCRLSFACGLVLMPFGISASSSAEPSLFDNSGLYGSLNVAAVGFVRGAAPDVTLTGWRPISLSGSAQYESGFTASATAGWQFRTGSNNDLFFRVEGEYWLGQFQRSNVQVGRLNITTDDKLSAQALFLNGLVRFGATENTRWWAGVGIGYASLRIPGLHPQVSGCNCLGSDTAAGLSFRAKIQGEYLMSDMTALFIELGYVYLPSGSVTNNSSKTQYSSLSVPQIGLGLRQRF